MLTAFVLMGIKEIRKRNELKIPLCNPSDENFFLRQSCQASTTELFCENSKRP